MIATEESVAKNQLTEGAPVSESSTVHSCPECGRPVITTPALHCSKCGDKHHLRCFVRKVGADCFVAECIDLDITVEAKTLTGAIAGLQDAMRGYLDVVFESQDTDTQGIVLRPAPLSHRIRYHLYG